MAAKKQNRGRTVHDWDQIKAAYLVSPVMDARDYLRSVYGMAETTLTSGNVSTRIVGWREEKLEYRKKMSEEYLEESKGEMKAKMGKLMKNFMGAFLRKLGEDEDQILQNMGTMNHKEVKTNWEIIRTENGLPTRITEELGEGGGVVIINDVNPYDPNEETRESNVPPTGQ